MTKEEAWNYINEINKAGSILGLDSMRALLNRLDNPQDKIKIVHIAGTNGKGSTGAFLESILSDAGYKTGRYISPTIFTYLERFQINSKYISETEFVFLLDKVKLAADMIVEEGYARPTAFETETALAYLYFLNNNVDVAIIECGMGGKDDATNLCSKPVCTIITSVSMDHMQFLGDSIYDILDAKLGILKQGVPCVADFMPDDMKKIWLAKCDFLKCSHIMTNIDEISVINETYCGTEFIYKNKRYCISLLGKFQINNSILAIEAAEVLNKSGIDLNYVNIYNGLMNAVWKGRFQVINKNPLIIVDGAHNEGGWISLRDNIETYLKDKELIFVCGVFKDKEYNKMLKLLSPYSECLYAVTPNNGRALDGELLKQYAEVYFKDVRCRDINSAMDEAFNMAAGNKDLAILVFGSLSFIGPIIERYELDNGQN